MPPLPTLPELDNDEVNNLFDSFGEDNVGEYDPPMEESIENGENESLVGGENESLVGDEDSFAGGDSDDEGKEAQLFINHEEHDEEWKMRRSLSLQWNRFLPLQHC